MKTRFTWKAYNGENSHAIIDCVRAILNRSIGAPIDIESIEIEKIEMNTTSSESAQQARSQPNRYNSFSRTSNGSAYVVTVRLMPSNVGDHSFVFNSLLHTISSLSLGLIDFDQELDRVDKLREVVKPL